MDSFKSISLFSGAQGLDIGLSLAGIDIVLGQDVEPSCIQTMRVNGHQGLAGDIRSNDRRNSPSILRYGKCEGFVVRKVKRCKWKTYKYKRA